MDKKMSFKTIEVCTTCQNECKQEVKTEIVDKANEEGRNLLVSCPKGKKHKKMVGKTNKPKNKKEVKTKQEVKDGAKDEVKATVSETKVETKTDKEVKSNKTNKQNKKINKTKTDKKGDVNDDK